jgi:hypothetical protein
MSKKVIATAKSNVITPVGDAVGKLKAKKFRFVVEKYGAMKNVHDFRYRVLAVDEDDSANAIEVKDCSTFSTAQQAADKHLAANRESPPVIRWYGEKGKRVTTL